MLKAVPRSALYLGVSGKKSLTRGLIPFVGTSVAAFAMPEVTFLMQEIQIHYGLLGLTLGACILSFMGAVHWGLAMTATTRVHSRFTLSVIPSLIAFASLQVPGDFGTSQMMQLAGFNGLLAGDFYALKLGLVPGWYMPLRLGLTTVVTGCISSLYFMGRNRTNNKD